MKTASVLSMVWLVTVWPVVLFLIGVCGPVEPEDAVDSDLQAIYTQNLLDAREIAYASYELAYGQEVSDACTYKVRHLERHYLPQAQLRAACGTTLSIGGCSFYYSDNVFIEDVLSNSVKTHAHEFMHIVLGCMRGNTDHSHAGSAWSYLQLLTIGSS